MGADADPKHFCFSLFCSMHEVVNLWIFISGNYQDICPLSMHAQPRQQEISNHSTTMEYERSYSMVA